MTFTLWLYVIKHTIYIWFIQTCYQKTWAPKFNLGFLLKLNNDPPSFKKTYFTHFKTNLSDFWSSKITKQWSKISSFKLQTGFISLNQTMTPFISKKHILLIKTNSRNFYGFECIRCRITKYFWGSKKIKQWP